MSKDSAKLDGKKILLAVSGGIAAYKSVDLASKIVQAGGDVKIIMTENACNLIGPKTFEAITGNAVSTDMWQKNAAINHIKLAQWADVIVIAPATANIIAKIATGICDDLLSTTICAGWKKPVIIAPAMNNNMWANPAVGCNIKTLTQRDFIFVGPSQGRLACGDSGKGRMSQPEEIIKVIETVASKT